MGWFGSILLLAFPWGLSYCLTRFAGVPIDFWMPLLWDIAFFSMIFNEIRTNVLTGLYKFYNRYKIDGYKPQQIARRVLDDEGMNRVRVDTTAIGYFTFGELDGGVGRLELAPEIVTPFESDSGGKGRSKRSGDYSAGAYGLLFRQLGMTSSNYRPGVLMFFKRLLTIPANFAGFVYIFPITFGYAFFGSNPRLQHWIILCGFILFGIVLLYIAILIPCEFVVGMKSRRLLYDSAAFDVRDRGLIRRFIGNYSRLAIILTVLNIMAIFIPMSRGNK
jgi:Zn-dependent membrane protease YugP